MELTATSIIVGTFYYKKNCYKIAKFPIYLGYICMVSFIANLNYGHIIIPCVDSIYPELS